MNTILYVNRTGIAWRCLPHDFPPHSTVFSHFSAWTADCTIEKPGIRPHRLVRGKEGREPEPTACVIDAQSVRTAPGVPAPTQGIDAGKKLLTQLAKSHPRITKARVDTGYRTQAVEHGAWLGIEVDAVPRNAQVKGFSVVPRRSVVERSFGWITMHRRLARGYGTKPEHSERRIRLAMISNLTRRATGESTMTWHNP